MSSQIKSALITFIIYHTTCKEKKQINVPKWLKARFGCNPLLRSEILSTLEYRSAGLENVILKAHQSKRLSIQQVNMTIIYTVNVIYNPCSHINTPEDVFYTITYKPDK